MQLPPKLQAILLETGDLARFTGRYIIQGGTNPFKYLVITRVAASTLMLPVLVVRGDAISLFGSFVGVKISSNTSFALFFRRSRINLLSATCYPYKHKRSQKPPPHHDTARN